MVYKYYDEKPKRLEKLSKDAQEDLLCDLINAFSVIKSPTESALFVQDLLTQNEAKVLSKRLRVAKLLLQGKSYEEIKTELHNSFATIAKVGYWLQRSGEGFRAVVKKLPQKTKTKHWSEYTRWDKAKRQYPSFLWPDVLLEEAIKSANKKDKERLRKVLKNLDQKSGIHKKIQELIDEEYREKASAKKRAQLRARGPEPKS